MASMKVGTDAVLLGAWAGSISIDNILDIGTGSGVVALMMAQRFPEAEICGIDIHNGSVKQAEMNFKNSPWEKRIHAKEISLQELSEKENSYGLIVSNPPYFHNSLLPPDQSRKVARHNESLSYEDLIRCSKLLLHPEGKVSFILPCEIKKKIQDLMNEHDMHLQRELDVIPVKGKEANRFLSEWGNIKVDPQIDTLTIRTDPNNYSSDYREFTREFYVAL